MSKTYFLDQRARAFRLPLAALLTLLFTLLSAQPSWAAATGEASALGSLDDMRAGTGAMGDRDTLPGAGLYLRHCASCHAGQVYKAPHTSWLEMMSARTLYKALSEGIMQTQAAALSEEDRIHIIEYLTQAPFDRASTVAQYNRCDKAQADFDAFKPELRNGWGADTRRFVPPEAAGIDKQGLTQLELKWSFGFPDSNRARSQPTIAMGAVFVGSQDGTVYALDLETGCVRWAFEARAEVRTGIVVAQNSDGSVNAYFGDLIANLYAVDARSGELKWQRRADGHHSATLTATPAYHNDRLYVPVSSLEVIPAADPAYNCCDFRGHVLALDARSGETVWDAYSIPEKAVAVGTTPAGATVLAPSGAPVWTSPTIIAEQDLLIFGTGENYSSPADSNSDAIIAVRLSTGERLWSHQNTAGDAWNVACMMRENPNCPAENGPDYDQSSSPLFYAADDGRTMVVAGQKDGRVFALDAATGSQRLWQVDVARGSIQGGIHFGMAAEANVVYAPVNDMNDTRNGEWLDPATARPGINAIDMRSGEILWSHLQADTCGDERPLCDPGISAPVTAVAGAVIAGHLDGYVRIYDGATGEVIWSYNTARSFDTTNGIKASGGSMSGSGAAVGDGYVALNSGYGLYFHEPGNVLLVFGKSEE